MDMIKELFYGKLGVDNLGCKKTSDYSKLRSRINFLAEDMAAYAPREQCLKLLDSVAELDDCISITYFSLGFRWGARMMLSVMTDDTETFEKL